LAMTIAVIADLFVITIYNKMRKINISNHLGEEQRWVIAANMRKLQRTSTITRLLISAIPIPSTSTRILLIL
jgi:hypothetical protein